MLILIKGWDLVRDDVGKMKMEITDWDLVTTLAEITVCSLNSAYS